MLQFNVSLWSDHTARLLCYQPYCYVCGILIKCFIIDTNVYNYMVDHKVSMHQMFINDTCELYVVCACIVYALAY